MFWATWMEVHMQTGQKQLQKEMVSCLSPSSVLLNLWHYAAYTGIKEIRNEVNLLNQVNCQQVAKN